MTVKNHITQDLMWKYKEEFVFEELGASEQDGELELVLSIIDDTEQAIKYNQNKFTVSTTRRFVDSLNKRVGHEANFVILLEIYNKLMKFESISFLKHSLVKLILKNPGNIYTHDKETRRDFEKCLNIQEIIHSVIHNQGMIFVREYLKGKFPLESFHEIVEKSIENLDKLEEDDDVYDAQDYDELRDYQYIALINIYTQLYLNLKHSNTNWDELLVGFKAHIAPGYIRMLNQFNDDSDFYDSETFKKSRMKFLIEYMQVFLKGIQKFIAYRQDEQLKEGSTRNFSHSEQIILDASLSSFSGVKAAISDIEQAFNEVNERLIEWNNEEIREFVHLINHDEITLISSHSTGSRKTNKIQSQRTMRIFKPATTNKVTNLRSTESFNFSAVWKRYVSTITSSRESRKLIDDEHIQLARLLFDTLTSENTKPQLIDSYKTFLSTSIDYVYVCEKANWTLYAIIFIFKLNSMILNLCSQNLKRESQNVEQKIDSNILDALDTVRTSSMIFRILSSSKDNYFTYSNEIFWLASYFWTKLLRLRTKSIQGKFLNFPSSQHFFKKCHEHIEVHMEKLSKGSLKSLYSEQKYTDELSRRWYLVDKNLEKQIVTLLCLLCSNDNREMQNYMREQMNNPKSYNMVTLLTNYASKFLDHLYFPVAFDTFRATLEALLEFVQGPNLRNQEIVIQHNFVELANTILKLEYNEEAKTLDRVYKNKSRLSHKVSYIGDISSIRHTRSHRDSSKYEFDFSSNVINSPANNFMTSLIKYKSLIVLLQLLVGKKHPSYIFYQIRRVIDPDTLRLNFAYQEYFRQKFHKNEYDLDLFFRYDQHIDQNIESPLIIEIGFLLYFLLMRLQENLFKDMDERYFEIVTLLSQKSEASSAVQKSAIIRFYEFFKDTCELATRC